MTICNAAESRILTNFHLPLRLIPRAISTSIPWRLAGWGANCTCGPQKLRSFLTGIDANSADTMLTAMAAIDAGLSSVNRLHKEKYWRCLDRASQTGPDRGARQTAIRTGRI
jgi:hypothetical protein